MLVYLRFKRKSQKVISPRKYDFIVLVIFNLIIQPYYENITFTFLIHIKLETYIVDI